MTSSSVAHDHCTDTEMCLCLWFRLKNICVLIVEKSVENKVVIYNSSI